MLLGIGLIWLLLSFAVCAFAEAKGRNGFAAFLAAIVLSPLIGFLIVAGLGDKKAAREQARVSTAGTRACPMCAERIKNEAVICRFCQSKVEPVAPPARAGSAVLTAEGKITGEGFARLVTAMIVVLVAVAGAALIGSMIR